MSLQGLISGSECALPNNPLAQVLKHTDGDRSAQRDRVSGPSSSRLQHLPSSVLHQASENDITMARQFFDRPPPDMHTGIHPGFSGQMLGLNRPLINSELPLQNSLESVQQDLVRMYMQAGVLENPTGPQISIPSSSSAWTSEFNSSARSVQQVPEVIQNTSSQSSIMHGSYMSSFNRPMGMNMNMFSPGFSHMSYPTQEQGKGKGKARDDAFEAAFAEFSTEAATVSSTKIEEIPQNLSELENRFKNTTISDSDSKLDERAATIDDFKTIWDSLRTSENPPSEEDIAKMETEFKQLMESQKDSSLAEYDYGASMAEAWENGLGQYDGDMMPSTRFDEEGVPILEPYNFDQENKYLTVSDSTSRLDQAKQLLENNGSLTEAALLLEAAITHGELGVGGYEAWILLGETRCMDEREEAGMRALMEGVKKAEESGAKGEGMLSLAIAFTNEGYERGSHAMLLRWLSARFPEHVPSLEETARILRSSQWVSKDTVMEAFLSVARDQHKGNVVDADVQVGLGVLFYTNQEYDRARDCFYAALSVRPRDYLLWNRLGSALSNGDKPEEALGAYREALQIRPTYTRAIYNVGVACLNINADKEAAEHFLTALSLQETASGDKSDQLWFTLRRALLAMGRSDLAERAVAGGDVNSFRAEGFDF